MIGVRNILVYSSLLFSTFATPTHHHDDEISNWEKFSALVDTVDELALHRVLHALSPKFKDGVFSKDRTAIEHVHSENPVMATKLVHIAKRQTNTTTTTSAVSSSTSESSAAASVSSALSSALSNQITATSLPSPTSVLVAPSNPESATPIATQSNAVVFSTFGGGVTTLTSSEVNVHFTPSTSTRLYYSTLPNGNVQTSTTVVVVNAPVTATAAPTGAAGAATTSPGAGLQSRANKVDSNGIFAALAGVIGLITYL